MEKKLRICVYAISKNEAHFAQRFCESAQDADLIMIADTGSEDGLPEKAELYGAVVHHICITPWRFDLARNAALALVPRDCLECLLAINPSRDLLPSYSRNQQSGSRK